MPSPARELVVCIAPFVLLSCATPRADLAPAVVGWVCQRTYPAGEAQLWVNQTLDSEARPIARSAGYRTHGSPSVDLFWEFPAEGPWHSTPTKADFGFSVDGPPRGPATAFLYRAGQRVAERVVVGPKVWRSWRRVARWGGSIGFYDAEVQVPDFHGVTDIRLTVVDPQRPLLDVPVPMPDWAWIDARVAEALAELSVDAEAQLALAAAGSSESRCLPQSGPEI